MEGIIIIIVLKLRNWGIESLSLQRAKYELKVMFICLQRLC